MKIFQKMYDMTLEWAKHKHAQTILCVVSFTESVIFPIPPDVMLAPMALAKPHAAWRLALLTTLASVAGGAVGYALGYWLYDPVVAPMVETMNLHAKLDHAKTWFLEYGVWIVFIAGFSPIPYKVFTVTAGVMQMAFIPFLIASAVGRGGRFFLVAGLMRWGGEKMQNRLREIVDWLGWGLVLIIVILLIIYKL